MPDRRFPFCNQGDGIFDAALGLQAKLCESHCECSRTTRGAKRP